MSTLSSARLAEIRERWAAATPGPYAWVTDDGRHLTLGTQGAELFEGHILTSRARCSACQERDVPCLWPNHADGEFLKHSWSDLADLLAEVNRQQGIITSLMSDGGRQPVDAWTKPPSPGAGAAMLGRTDVCGCESCYEERTRGLFVGHTPLYGFRFACEICGSKRCPHHADHRFQCTGSNELNQVGVPIEEPESPPAGQASAGLLDSLRPVDDAGAGGAA